MQTLPKKIHIVSFDIPYPPNYGGVIDVFYKIKTLHKLGIEIHLHAYEYGRKQQKELKKYCAKIYYYKRNLGAQNLISKKPFIVKTRSSHTLLENLIVLKIPIIFEGLHTTSPLLKHSFKNRKVAIRMHNIEHNYYKGLAKSEKRISKKIFLKMEAKKLKKYEQIVEKSAVIFSISPFEQAYFSKKYQKESIYIPVFHPSNNVKSLSEKGEFILFHGDLRVSDNIKAATFLIHLFSSLDYKLVIASSFKSKGVSRKIATQKNIEFVTIDSQKTIENLLEKAHINTILTFQKTGIKLKLLNTLFNSRFTIANTKMIEDTGLEDLCTLANTETEFKTAIVKLMSTNYTTKDIQKKKQILTAFNSLESAQKIIKALF